VGSTSLHDDVILPLAIESKGISPSPSSSNSSEGDDNIWESLDKFIRPVKPRFLYLTQPHHLFVHQSQNWEEDRVGGANKDTNWYRVDNEYAADDEYEVDDDESSNDGMTDEVDYSSDWKEESDNDGESIYPSSFIILDYLTFNRNN
jgi:hypothetical protein